MTPPYSRKLIGYDATPQLAQWPGDARIAPQFVINYEKVAENSILQRDPAAESLLSGIVDTQHVLGARPYEYGSRTGFWRLHQVLTVRAAPVRFYGVTMAIERNSPPVHGRGHGGGWRRRLSVLYRR
jgi:allantoinase